MVRVFKIAVCGAGVVGGGVINLIKRNHVAFQASNFDFQVKMVRPKDNSWTLPSEDLLTHTLTLAKHLSYVFSFCAKM